LVGSIFHMTRKIVSEMTYNVSMGTLNPTIPYLLNMYNVSYSYNPRLGSVMTERSTVTVGVHVHVYDARCEFMSH